MDYEARRQWEHNAMAAPLPRAARHGVSGAHAEAVLRTRRATKLLSATRNAIGTVETQRRAAKGTVETQRKAAKGTGGCLHSRVHRDQDLAGVRLEDGDRPVLLAQQQRGACEAKAVS